MEHDGDHGEHRGKGKKSEKKTKRPIDPQYERRFAELIESIDDWEALTRELIVYTVRKHGERAYRFGMGPDDYAQRAIEAALSMRRIYDFGSGKTFDEFLESAIDSDLSHQLRRKIHRTVRLESRADAGDDRPLSGYDQDKLVSSDRPDRVIDEIDAERERAALPQDLRRLHELNQSTQCTAKEKARRLGITVAEVWNMQRRLKRSFKRKRSRTI